MGKTIAVLDFDSSSVSAGVFTGSGSQLQLSGYCSSPVERDIKKAVAGIVDALRAKGVTDFSRVIAGLPPEIVSMRIIELPFQDKKKIEGVLQFEVRDFFLKNVDELILSALPLAQGKVLVAAVEKAVLEEWLEALKESGIDPFWITTGLLSRHILLKRSDAPEVLAFVDSSSVTVAMMGKPRFFKAVSGASDLSFALRAIEEDGIVVEKFYSTAEASKLLKELGRDAAVLDECTEGKTGLLALAGHFVEGAPMEAINFLTGEFADNKDVRAAEKGFKTAAVLLSAIVVLWGAYSYTRYSVARNSLAQAGKKLYSAYRELFPAEARVVDASLQMDAKLKSLKDEERVLKGGVNPLRVMAALSEAAAGGNGRGERIYSLSVEHGRLVANGYAGSFEGANNFRESLSRLPYFSDITLADVKARAGGGASFSISASIKERP